MLKTLWKSFSFYALLFASTSYYFGLGLIFLFFWRKKEDVIAWVASHWGKFNLKQAGIQLDIVGLENTHTRPAIFIYNHQSILDIFILSTLISHKTLPMAKKSFLYFPFLGWFMKTVGAVFVERHDPQKAMLSLKQAQKVIREGYSFVMAPEGTRTRTGELLPFKRGAFQLALQMKLPIIPIIFSNAYSLFPKDAWSPHAGIVKVKILPPIDAAHWSMNILPEKIEEIRNVYLTYLT